MGAGGKWKIFEEILDPRAIRQRDRVSCGLACGEMLLKELGIEHIDQQALATRIDVPVDVSELVKVMNAFTARSDGEWRLTTILHPDPTYEATVNWLTKKGVWAAEFREIGAGIGHLVIVDGLDKRQRLRIRDPWEGTGYKWIGESLSDIGHYEVSDGFNSSGDRIGDRDENSR